MDDKLIIELFRKRDENAIAELKKKYNKLCFYVAGNILSQSEDVEECVNSAYFDVWNDNLPADPADLEPYLCRIVKNKAIDRLKYNFAEKRSAQLTVSLDELADCIPAKAEEELSAAQLAETISRFLHQQDEVHRKVFVRRYWFGDSLGHISKMYGNKEKTIATYLYRTREKLKEYLRKEGYDHE